jgi:cell division septum initiation protein DivIVA
MDWNDIERMRVEGFPIVRRGYDRRSVDKFLTELADWLETDAATDIGQKAITRKLELVGKSTANILLTTEQESEQMRRRAEEECAELRSDAEAAALATRRAADEYAKKVCDKAEQEARQIQAAASAKAKQNIEEGQRRRAQIEDLVDDLNARRDHALAELDHLRDELGAAIESHRGGRSDGETGGKASDGTPVKTRAAGRAKAPEREAAKAPEGEAAKAPDDGATPPAGQRRSARGRAAAPTPPR